MNYQFFYGNYLRYFLIAFALALSRFAKNYSNCPLLASTASNYDDSSEESSS